MQSLTFAPENNSSISPKEQMNNLTYYGILVITVISKELGMGSTYRFEREFQGYTGKKFSKDIIAGITVAAVRAACVGVGIAGAGRLPGWSQVLSAGLLRLCCRASYQLSGPTGTMTAILAITVASIRRKECSQPAL